MEPGLCSLLGAQTLLREARPSFRGLELSEKTREDGNPGTAFALVSAAFSFANVPALLEWETVLRGQGSSGIDQKLDRRPCQVTAMAGGFLGAVAALGPEWQGRIQFPPSSGAQIFPAPSFPTLPPVIRALSRKRTPIVSIIEPAQYLHYAKPVAPPHYSKITISI